MKLALAELPAWRTDRLVLRPLAKRDASAVALLTDDPAITDAINFLQAPFTVSDAEQLIESNDDENCFLGAWLGDELIGIVGAHGRGIHQLEIGYWIGSRHHRKGYATEAVSSVISKLRHLYSERQIVAECRRENEGSWTLLLKLGFRPTGEQGNRPGRERLAL